MAKILIVEDEEPISNLIRMNLTKVGYQCKCAFDGEMAANEVQSEAFDLVLLDIMLPKISGYDLLPYMKSVGVPVIFLTAMGTTKDKVKGLLEGAEDYITKPFDISELLARVEVVLRRYHKSDDILSVNDVEIHVSSMEVIQDGHNVDLTSKEYNLLLFFARNKNIALYRNVIYENVWEGEYLGDSRTVDLHVQRLKKKLKWDKEIVAVYKVGYKMEDE